MASLASKPPAFETILNFRDIGSFINTATGARLLHSGLFFRSARPDAATEADRSLLVDHYKIKTIIDLRTPTEHIQARKKYAADVPSAPAVTEIGVVDPKYPFRISGIQYKDIDFNGKGYSNSLLKQLSWRHTAKLYGLYVFGYRVEAIRVLGENVMAPRGLTALTEDTLEHCRAEVAQVFSIFADPSNYPILIHCTQGKDRTGLNVLLVLLLLGMPVEAIQKDYLASQNELESEREERLKEITAMGLPESFADCPKDWVQATIGWIDGKYGGVEKYLEGCGVVRQQMESIKQTLMA